MSAMSIVDTRNNFSTIIGDIASGLVREHIVYNRSTPVAKIVPYDSQERPSARTFGLAKDDGLEIDYEAFDALDGEIADEFGV